MFRQPRVLCGLPFEPMALSNFDVLERAVAGGARGASPSSCHSEQGPPYFISPKHDGVRVVSYVHPRVHSGESTCFSRFGRPIYGMTWIEEELRLLRWLSGDPRLVLDGELYIHRSHDSRSTSCSVGQSGFLAVSSLVHRLRSAKSACSSQDDLLRYVASLPKMCVFDIVSFQPSERIKLKSDQCWRGIPRVEKERLSLLRKVMAANHIPDLEVVRIIPNYSVFPQRLKALHFLASLLECARASSTFFPGRIPGTVEDQGEDDLDGSVPDYEGIGGKYVKLVPYSLITTLEEAQTVHLQKYLSSGYEGAVIRSVSNVYEVREKEKDVIKGLLYPLLCSSKPSLFALHSQNGSKKGGAERMPLLRVHSEGEHMLTCSSATATGADVSKEHTKHVESDEDVDHREIVQRVLRRAKEASRRSSTAVKLLPFEDKEYAILKPLLKLPTTDVRSRNLLTIPVSFLHEGLTISMPRTLKGKATTKGSNAGGSVVFYGIQCLSDTGRVFNVSLPKMNAEKQQALLDHLLEVTGGYRGAGTADSRRASGRTLTGLYATVKYHSLTDYGVPRFGQVKAIRGGKGWFL